MFFFTSVNRKESNANIESEFVNSQIKSAFDLLIRSLLLRTHLKIVSNFVSLSVLDKCCYNLLWSVKSFKKFHRLLLRCLRSIQNSNCTLTQVFSSFNKHIRKFRQTDSEFTFTFTVVTKVSSLIIKWNAVNALLVMFKSVCV